MPLLRIFTKEPLRRYTWGTKGSLRWGIDSDLDPKGERPLIVLDSGEIYCCCCVFMLVCFTVCFQGPQLNRGRSHFEFTEIKLTMKNVPCNAAIYLGLSIGNQSGVLCLDRPELAHLFHFKENIACAYQIQGIILFMCKAGQELRQCLIQQAAQEPTM